MAKKIFIMALFLVLFSICVNAELLDDFNRPNNLTVGNDWIENETAYNTWNIANGGTILQGHIASITTGNYMNVSHDLNVWVSQINWSVYLDNKETGVQYYRLYDVNRLVIFSIEARAYPREFYYADNTGLQLISAFNEDVLYTFKIDNINYTSLTLDIYFNGILKQAGVSFTNATGKPQTFEIGSFKDPAVINQHEFTSYTDNIYYNITSGAGAGGTDYCVDSDGGKDNETFGFAYNGTTLNGTNYNDTNPYGYPNVIYDTCSPVTPEFLYESYCSNTDTTFVNPSLDCTIDYYSCIAGRCVNESTYNIIEAGILAGTLDPITGQNITIDGDPVGTTTTTTTTTTTMPVILQKVSDNVQIIFALIFIIGLVILTASKTSNPLVLMFVGVIATIIMSVLGVIPASVLIMIVISLVLLVFLGFTLFKKNE